MTSNPLPSSGARSHENEHFPDDGKYNINNSIRLRRKSKGSRKSSDFNVSYKQSESIPEYNGLKDPHLYYHFYNKKLRKLLRKNGLLTKAGEVVEKKSCLNEYETNKHSILHKDLTYKPVQRGTMVLSKKLPEIIQVPAAKIQKPKQARPNEEVKPPLRPRRYDSHSNEGPNSQNSLDVSVISSEQPHSSFLKPPKQQIPLSKTPTKLSSDLKKEPAKMSLNKSADMEGRQVSRIGYNYLTKPKPVLKPLTKDELQAVFEKYKKKFYDSAVVTEASEVEENASGNSSQRKSVIKEQQQDDKEVHKRSKSAFDAARKDEVSSLQNKQRYDSNKKYSSKARDNKLIQLKSITTTGIQKDIANEVKLKGQYPGNVSTGRMGSLTPMKNRPVNLSNVKDASLDTSGVGKQPLRVERKSIPRLGRIQHPNSAVNQKVKQQTQQTQQAQQEKPPVRSTEKIKNEEEPPKKE